MILGIDLSAANPEDAGRIAPGIRFGHCKVSEGSTYRDPKFAAHARAYTERGIPWSAYHVWRFNGRPPEEQAEFFLRNMRVFPTEWSLPLVFDVETEHGASPAARVEHLIKGLRYVRSAVKRCPMLYTYPSYWAGLGAAGLAEEFAEYDLWLAAYTDARAATTKYPPKDPKPWAARRLWQFGGDVNGSKLEGVRGYVDQSVFEGDEDAFAAWVNPPELALSEPERRFVAEYERTGKA